MKSVMVDTIKTKKVFNESTDLGKFIKNGIEAEYNLRVSGLYLSDGIFDLQT